MEKVLDSSTEKYEYKLSKIITSNADNKVILDEINSEFSHDDCSSKPFIRALVISVCKIDQFYEKKPILEKYIGQDKDLQYEALLAVQALDDRLKNQPGLSLFNNNI